MKKAEIVTFACFIFLYLNSLAAGQVFHAVESNGEINAKDNNAGTVIAGTKADLILTLMADMSQAEPGEEIAAIQITMPDGFSAGDKAVTSVTKGEKKIDFKDFKSVVDVNQITVSLPIITLTTVVQIEFTVNTPPIPGEAFFTVGLLNISQNPIIVSIKDGNADGRVNNDTLTLKVVAATKPLPPSLLSVRPDPGGENDIIISWTKSEDPSVSGYLIYPSDRPGNPVDVPRREQTSYTDMGLVAGQEYTYTVRSYKTKNLVSDASSKLSAVAPKDTKAPQPPVIQPEVKVLENGVEISWTASLSRDVEKYIIYRGPSLDTLKPISEAKPDMNSYIDKDPPKSGSYIYVVEAVDDAGNKAKSSATQPRQTLAGAKPQPNPFTPLGNPPYDQVTFPAAMAAGGEGTFAIKIYDLEGDLVFEKEAEEGTKEIKWNGKDMNDRYVGSGVYIYQATMGDKVKIGTIIVAK